MWPRLGHSQVLARLVVVLLAVGCAGPTAPTGQPTPVATSATGGIPIPSLAPGAAATPAAVASVRWEEMAELPHRPYLEGITYGPAGWVALGDCPECGPNPATAFFSEDSQTWSTHSLPRAKDVGPVSVTSSAAGYVIGAIDSDDVGDDAAEFLQVWRSSDGKAWDRVGELSLGLRSVGQHFVKDVALTPTGAIVIGQVELLTDSGSTYSGPFYSEDGASWSPIDASAFGVDAIVSNGVEATDSGLVLVGTPCTDCPARVWTSTDGLTWRPTGELTSNVSSASIASNGRTLVAALQICESGECVTELWSSVDGQAWAMRMRRDDFVLGRVTWAGGAFLLVGKNDAIRSRIFTSVDGIAWSEASNPASDEDCGAAWFAGGAGVVLYGDPDCRTYRGRVTVSP